MIRPQKIFGVRFHSKGLFHTGGLAALLIAASLAGASVGRANSAAFTYDAGGNEASQQHAVAGAPVILGASTNQVLAEGETGGFSVVVSSGSAVTYQWYFNGVAIPGATSDSLLLSNVSSANDGNYTVKVTNSNGTVTSKNYKLGFDGNGNGLPDSWEMANFGNLLQTAQGDYDGDGICNLDEYTNGTDPTVREIFYWNAASGNFNIAANWVRHNAPGAPSVVPGVGDTAVINSGTFTLPASTILTTSQVTVNVPFAVPTDVDFTLSISGIWTFARAFTLADGKQFIVTGGGSATVTGPTTLNAANLYVSGGSKLNLTKLANYTVPAASNVFWDVVNDGSQLTFSNLKTITGSTAPNSYLNLRAYSGASLLSVPALTTITKPDDGDASANSGIALVANNGATLSAPLLASFHDDDSHPASSITAEYGATSTLYIPKLLAPKGLNIDLNAQSHPEQFTSVTNCGSFQINNGTVAMSNLDSLTGIGHIYVIGGAVVSFPNAASYTVPAGGNVYWDAVNAGSQLSFPNLSKITGSTAPNSYLNLRAYSGTSLLSLPALTTITKPDDGDGSANSGIALGAYDGATLDAPLLASFHDNDSHPASSITAENSATSNLHIPKLLTPKGLNIDLNAQSHPAQFTSVTNCGTFQINNGTVSMSNLGSVDGIGRIYVTGGAVVSFPGITNYTVPAAGNYYWDVISAGSQLSFPNLQTITGSTTPNSYLNLRAYSGTSLLSVPALTTITKPDDGDGSANSGIALTVYDGATLSAPLLATFHDNDSHPASSITADNSATSTLDIPKLLAPKGVNIDLNAQSHPEQFTSVTNCGTFEVNNGTVTMSNLGSLTGIARIYVIGGAVVSFPKAVNYTVPAGWTVYWDVVNAGSQLLFPKLKTITGSTAPNSYLNVRAYGGASLLSMPVLTTITKPDDGDGSFNSGIALGSYDGATISAPLLATFHDNDSHPGSSITAGNGGMFDFVELAQSGIIGVTLNGVTLPANPPPLVMTPSAGSNGAVAQTENDSNLDAQSDILYFNPATRETRVNYLNGVHSLSVVKGPVLTNGWQLIDAADFDRDGKQDYLIFNPSNGQTAIWYLDGVTFLRSAAGPTVPSSFVPVAAADFDGDGQPDLLLVNDITGTTTVLYMNDNAQTGSAAGPNLPAGFNLVGVADFDGNGTPDLLLFNPTTLATSIWYMNRATFQSSVAGPDITAGYTLSGVADLNGDGNPDFILVKTATNDTAVWYLNNATFIKSVAGPTPPPGFTLVVPYTPH